MIRFQKYACMILCLFFLMPMFDWSQVQGKGRRPSGHYMVGRLVRPLDNPVATVLPEHHDVLVRDISGLENHRRGFFADNMLDAFFAYLSWVVEHYSGEIPMDGWVAGHVGNEGPWGEEDLARVSRDRYLQVYNRMNHANSNRYHLSLYNCQTWAAEQLSP